jgi:hypothetical protein
MASMDSNTKSVCRKSRFFTLLPKIVQKGIKLNFWNEITGDFDEAEDEAEASHMN